MNNTLENSLQIPKFENGFYLFDHFFQHDHNLDTANLIYAIPWETGIIFTTKRNPETAGCVGCLVRRLISTTYHKPSKISRVDSIFFPYDIKKSSKIMEWYKEIITQEISATRCLIFQFDEQEKEELHILPVPGCPCSKNTLPSISSSFAEHWLLKWPNIVIERYKPPAQIDTFQIRSSKLPNTSLLFLQNPGNSLFISKQPTAADFRDSKNLELRLNGESIERYSSTYVPQSYLQQDSIVNTNKKNIDYRSIMVENFFGECQFVPAEKIFSGLHLHFPDKSPLSSSGVAAHKTFQNAKISATLELLERDALLIAWRLADTEHSMFFSLPTQILTQIREFEWTCRLANQQHHELQILGIKNQLQLPIVLAFTIPREGITTSPNFGAGIGFNWGSAIRKALCELLQGIAVPDYDFVDRQPKTFVERPRYWKQPERLAVLKRRLRVKNESYQQELFLKTYSLSELESTFLRNVFFANLTPSDVSLTGWYVVRAVCESFEPFPGDYKYEQPSIMRVNKFLESIQIPPVSVINIDPFPFP